MSAPIAPDKGSETRKKLVTALSKYKEDAQNYVEDTADKVKAGAKDVAAKVKDKAKNLADDAKDKAGN